MEAKTENEPEISTPSTLSCENLDDHHREIFTNALRNVLSTELASLTFGQIIDGLPLADVVNDVRWPETKPDHPLQKHTVLCPGVEDEAKKICTEFDPASLEFPPTLIKAFNAASDEPMSQAFRLRLIELVAVSLHQIAGRLNGRALHLHDPSTTDGMDIATVSRLERHNGNHEYNASPAPTWLDHPNFTAWEKYPSGIDDTVGYWAENRIVGGVCLFNRKQAWSEENQEPNVYFDSSRAGVTNLVCQLLDDQQNALVEFLLRGCSGPETCPLPILTSPQNQKGMPGYFAACSYFKIYRDPWERSRKARPWCTGCRRCDQMYRPDEISRRLTREEQIEINEKLEKERKEKEQRDKRRIEEMYARGARKIAEDDRKWRLKKEAEARKKEEQKEQEQKEREQKEREQKEQEQKAQEQKEREERKAREKEDEEQKLREKENEERKAREQKEGEFADKQNKVERKNKVELSSDSEWEFEDKPTVAEGTCVVHKKKSKSWSKPKLKCLLM